MNKHFRIAGRLADKLEEIGVPVSSVLRAAGLPPHLFQQTRVLVTTEQLFALWHAIGDVSPDPCVGLRLATETRTERFHPSAIAALSTTHFAAAVDHMARYKRLTCPEEMRHETSNGEWSIRFRWLRSVGEEPPVLIEYCFAWLLTIGRCGSGARFSPLRIEFVNPRPHSKAIERHFDCPVVAGSTSNAIVFRAGDALRPFVTRNAELLDMLAPQFEKELQEHQLRDTHGFVTCVQRAVQQRLTGHRPAIEDVARGLHMSSRTLQRKLREAGSSYQRVLDEARHQMARYYLGHSVLELTEAAYLLGYEDAKSFARAFRAWEGMPPGLWRESQRAAAS